MEVNVLVLDVAGKLTKWRNYFVTSLKLLLLFQRGEELFPKVENGKVIYDSVDFCRTWEVSPGRKPGEEPGDWEPPFFLPPVRMGCGLSDSAVHESKDWDVGVVGRKPLLKCSQERTESGMVKPGIYFLPCDMSSPGFSKEEMVNSSSCVMAFFSFFLS